MEKKRINKELNAGIRIGCKEDMTYKVALDKSREAVANNNYQSVMRKMSIYFENSYCCNSHETTLTHKGKTQPRTISFAG